MADQEGKQVRSGRMQITHDTWYDYKRSNEIDDAMED